MIKTSYFLLVILFSANAYAADLATLKAADIKDLDAIALPTALPSKAAPKKDARTYQNVFMQIRNQPSWGAVEADDMMARISISVRKVGDGWYDVSNRVDMDSQWGNVRRIFSSDWEISGSGMNLRMSEWGGNYSISGSVSAPGAAGGYINLTVNKSYDNFTYYVNDFGMNLNVDRYNVNGGFDNARYSKQAVTAVLSLLFAVQADATPAEPRKN